MVKSRRLRDALPYPPIFCATLLAYWPALRGTLLWDDNAHITRAELRSLHGLWRIWFEPGATQQYYPVLHSAFWIEHRIWGDAVLGYHLIAVTLHAAAACLVVAIVRRLAVPGAWFAGLVFALHPVCVESVAWISEQKNTLSAVFYLASALAYLRGPHYVLALALFLLALLSKTVTATLPVALLAVLWWRRGKLDWKLAPWLPIGAAAGLFTAWMERTSIGARGEEFALTVCQRVSLAARALFFYAGKLLWPAGLTFNYPRWTVDSLQGGFVLTALALLGAGIWLARRGHRGFLAAVLVFAATLFPALGLVDVYPFRYSYVADHFQYLASLALLVPAASLVIWRWPRAAIVAALGLLTWRQSGMYRDSMTLYSETLKRNPDSWLAHNNLGAILLNTPGGLPEAVRHIDAAIQLNSRYAEGHNNRGNALQRIPGRLVEAIAEYETALRINPEYAEAHDNLGTALGALPGRLPDTIAHYEAALRVQPALATARNNLGHALLQEPADVPRAITQLELALRLKPDYAEAHNNLGIALMRIPGRTHEAVQHFEAAIRYKSAFAEAHNNLGTALLQFPARRAEAIAAYQQALRIRPDYAGAHNNLGNALALMGRLEEAIREYEAALRIQPDFAAARVNLSNALLQTGGNR